MATTILGLFRSAGYEDPLADLKALAVWMKKLPPNDHLGIQEAIVRLLEDMGARQPRVTPNRVRAVLELDRISMPVQARLRRQFLQPLLSDSVRQRLWHAGDDVARWFAYTYENQFEAVQAFFLSQKAKGKMPAVAARMFYYRGEQAKHSLFRYERWIPGRWKGLHAAYAAAFECGVARLPFAVAPDSPAPEHCSAEQEYLQILLLQRVNTGNLSAVQIEMTALWLRTWAFALALTDPPLEGAGFWLDSGLGDGLQVRKPQIVQGTLRYLDIAPLQKEIGNALAGLSAQVQRASTPAIQAEAAERLALLRRLEQLWGPRARYTERRGARVHTDRPVSVAVGLVEIAAVLQGTDPENRALQRRFRQGDPAAAASGLVPPNSRPTAMAVTEHEPERSSGWRMHDTSASGCRLVSQSRKAAQQKLGSLLGVLEDGDTRWKIGIVRRLKKSSGGQTELGIEIVALNSLLVAPKPVASRDTGYSVDGIDVSVEGKGFDALYLPPMHCPGRTPGRSMVVPAPEYAEGRRFFMTYDDHGCTIEFTAAIERNKDWVWSGFDIVTQAQ
jgi:hypothetical protein